MASSVSSAGWMSGRRADLIVAVFMSLGVVFGSTLSFRSAVLQGGTVDVLVVVSALVAMFSLLSRVVPVSISQIALAGGIGGAVLLGPLPQSAVVQATFWVASPVLVFLITPWIYRFTREIIMRAASVQALDLTLKTMVHLSLVLLSFWSGVNIGGVLMAISAPQSNYWEVATLIAGIVLFSCLFARALPLLKSDMTFYPDPSAFASRALSSLAGVWLGLLFGVTASFTQLFYSSDLYFRSKMLASGKHIVKGLLLSWTPALASALLVFLLVLRG